MFKVLENNMSVSGNIMSGRMVLANELEDSKVIMNGSDSMNTTIEELESFQVFLLNMPAEVTEFKSATWSIEFQGPNAIELLLEVTNCAIAQFKAIVTPSNG